MKHAVHIIGLICCILAAHCSLSAQYNEKPFEIDSTQVRMDQNIPNPFVDTTVIPLFIPQEMDVCVEVRNSSGKIIYMLHRKYDRGDHTITLTRDMFPTEESPLYSYVIKHNEAILQTRKMIFVPQK